MEEEGHCRLIYLSLEKKNPLFTNAWRKELVIVAFTYLYCCPNPPSIIAYLSIFSSSENVLVK